MLESVEGHEGIVSVTSLIVISSSSFYENVVGPLAGQ